MTFQQFKSIAAARRPDIIVHAHKTFGGISDVAIIFERDGKQSKVYNYRGSYAQILEKLGVMVVTEEDILNVRSLIDSYLAKHGKPGLFTKGAPADYSIQIAELEAKLVRFETDEYVRVWEF